MRGTLQSNRRSYFTRFQRSHRSDISNARSQTISNAKVEDLAGIRQIIKPLEESGILVHRTDEELLRALDSFLVVEREGQIIACAALFPFFEDKCAEVAAIAVASDCRGQGQKR